MDGAACYCSNPISRGQKGKPDNANKLRWSQCNWNFNISRIDYQADGGSSGGGGGGPRATTTVQLQSSTTIPNATSFDSEL